MGALLSSARALPFSRPGRRGALSRRWPVAPLGLLFVALAAGGIVALASPVDALLVWGLALAMVLSLIEPLVGIGAALVIAPFQAWLSRVGGVPASPWVGQLFWLVGVGAWVARGVVRRDLRLRFPPLLGWLVLFIGVAWLSLWNAADPWMGLTELLKWLQMLATFVLVFDRLAPDQGGVIGARRCLGAVIALTLAALFQAVLGVWQSVLSAAGPETFEISEGYYRAFGTFEQPNPYGGFLGLVAALLAGLLVSAGYAWLSRRRPALRAVYLVSDHAAPPRLALLLAGTAALGLIGAGLVASWSRGAWMGFAAALLVILSVLPRRQSWGWLLMVVVILGGAAAYRGGWLPSAVSDRLTGFLEYTRFEDVRGVGINDTNFSVLERMAHWQAALGMARDHFWLGVGLGCYEVAYPTYMLANWALPLGHAHNIYLNLFAETGLLGLVTYIAFMVALSVRLLSALHALDGFPRWLAVGLMGAWGHFWIHNLVDNLLVNNVHLHIGVLLALTSWVILLARRDRRSASGSSIGPLG